jgi:hypothetical protein
MLGAASSSHIHGRAIWAGVGWRGLRSRLPGRARRAAVCATASARSAEHTSRSAQRPARVPVCWWFAFVRAREMAAPDGCSWAGEGVRRGRRERAIAAAETSGGGHRNAFAGWPTVLWLSRNMWDPLAVGGDAPVRALMHPAPCNLSLIRPPPMPCRGGGAKG